jgi:pilus assembly protein CpaD
MLNPKSRFLARPSALILSAVLASALAGCMADDPLENSFVPYSVDDRYPLGAAKGPVSLVVEASEGALHPGQRRAISGIARQAASAGVTPVTISVPSGGGGSKKVAAEVAQILVQNGVSSDMIRRETYKGSAGSAVSVSFVKAHGASRECGVWDQDLTETSSNLPFTNHGCAVRANMAAMIANPKDFELPRAMGDNPSANDIVAINKLGETSSGGSGGFRSFFF